MVEGFRAIARGDYLGGGGGDADVRTGVEPRVDGDLRPVLAEIDTQRCPLYLLTGTYDHSCLPADSERTARAIPGARHETVHGMGHEISTAVAPRLVGLIGENLARAAAEEVPA